MFGHGSWPYEDTYNEEFKLIFYSVMKNLPNLYFNLEKIYIASQVYNDNGYQLFIMVMIWL